MNSQQKLRVLHILPALGVAGGAEQMAAHLMIAVSQTHEVAAVSLSAAIDNVIEERLSRARIPCWHLGKHGGFDKSMFSAIHRVLGEFQPQIVHTHLSVLRYALPSIIRHRIPLRIHTLHNEAKHEADKVGQFVLRLALRAKVIPVAVSVDAANSFKRLYGSECPVTIPNCIPIENYRKNLAARAQWREKAGLDDGVVLFMFVGRLAIQKNPLLLLKSFAALGDARAQLAIVGDGNVREQVTEFVRVHGLGDKIHVLGKRTDIPACLAAADVFVSSSDWEGNPLSIMEAMASGLPIVCTSVGGVPELVQSGQHGIVIPPGDCVALTCAMRSLLENAGARRLMGDAARARAESSFSLELMVQRYEALYETVRPHLRDRRTEEYSSRFDSMHVEDEGR